MAMDITGRPPTPSEHPAASAAAIDSAHGKLLRPTPELAEAMNRGYEPKDISLRGLFIFLATLVATLIVVAIAIYAIMMALVDNDRSHDPLGTPVSVIRPETYAPLQPSVAHNTDDWQDMLTMRQQTQTKLASSGVSPTGRRYVSIGEAMNQVLPLLVVRPAVKDAAETAYPVGSTEGRYGPTVVGQVERQTD